jgi:hypothetical protein
LFFFLFVVGFFFFFFFKKTQKHPTRMGSVREPGSLTHPQVTPIETHYPLPTIH